jgi:high-affinity iron transporter
VAVLLQLCDKTGMRPLKRWIWIGAIAGVLLSLAFGVVFVLLFYLANTKAFSGQASLIFKASITWVACFFITWVAFIMLKFYNMERKLREKLTAAFENTVSRSALLATKGTQSHLPGLLTCYD